MKFSEEALSPTLLSEQLTAIHRLADRLPQKGKELITHLLDPLRKEGLEQLEQILTDAQKEFPQPTQETPLQKDQRVLAGIGYIVKRADAALKELAKTTKRISAQIDQYNKSNTPLPAEIIQAINDHLRLLNKMAAQMTFEHLMRSLQDTLKNNPREAGEVRVALEEIDRLTYRYFNGDLQAKPKEYLAACKVVIDQQIKPALQKQGDYWTKLDPAFKAFLGVLAALTVIPALVIAGTKKGYGKTFFEVTPDKKMEKALGKIVESDAKLKIQSSGK